MFFSSDSLVWSIGKHGPTEGLKDRLRPMLIKYNANAYFCGHDHDMQHIHEDNSTVEYFLSGAGHETEDSDDNKVPCTQTFGGSFQLLLKKIKLP